MANENTPKSVAFIFDDRLSHDRNVMFSRMISILKPKFHFEILPSSLEEKDFLEHLDQHSYSLILLPWHKYLAWKKVEAYFGSLRLHGTTVAGYFADAILPFEFTQIPNFHRMILLDFYRFDQNEVEMMIAALLQNEKKAGFSGLIPKTTPIFHADWFDYDADSTRCIDTALNTPLIHASHWSKRLQSLRLCLTSLWGLCFDSRHTFPNNAPCAHLEMAENNKRLMLKLVFESHELTLKHVLEYIWPNSSQPSQSMRELVRHADFIRIHLFPESHTVEIMVFFLPAAPVLHYPGEIRGFWIEPMKSKYLRDSEDAHKRIPIQVGTHARVTDQLHEVLERLRAIHSQMGLIQNEEKSRLEHQVSNIRFLITEIEKKVAEKKKVA